MRVTIKNHLRESTLFSERAAIALAVTALLMLAVIVRLAYLQIVSHEHFATLSDANRINIVPVPPTRGLIYDRNGVVLAQNLPSFSIEIIPEQVPDIEATIGELTQLIAISDGDISRFYKQLRQKRPFNTIPLRFQLDDREVARVAVNRHRLPGVEIEARVIRNYPLGAFAVHALGYVGRISEEELQGLDGSNYSATRFIGKTGVEKYYEDLLHGRVGFMHVETNALGRALRTVKRIPPLPGQNLYLTLDARLQRVAEDSLAGRRGAVVAIAPDTGEILALASMPGYDPNRFVTGIDPQSYQDLQTSLDKPLFNRALQGQYPPGSTLKPFIGLGALEYEKFDINTALYCPGWYMLEGDDRKYRDWKPEGHGHTTLDKAIVESCDVYFYDLALTLGIDRLHDFLARFGFGRRTGADFPEEAAGVLPSRQWKQRYRHQPWFPGETLIAGIGQGYTLTTPLQLAEATAILGRRGAHALPRVAYAMQTPGGAAPVLLEPRVAERLKIGEPRNWEQIIAAMVDVVHGARGTARAIGHNAPARIAGKTGTAQVFGIKQEEKYVAEEVAERLRDHALFIAFAPAEDPRIALAVVVENAGSGSSAAAPIARKIIDSFLEGKRS